MLDEYVLSDGISQTFLLFRFFDIIVLTDHDLFGNKGNNKITELRTILQRESPNS
jgi:hypothetical protein